MKLITKGLLGFALTTIILTLLFRICLSHGIEESNTNMYFLAPIIYFICMFINGFLWGRKDHDYLPIFDIGFRFHAVTYITFIATSELWFLIGNVSSKESIATIHTTAIIWGILLLIHLAIYLILRKKSINNLDKRELFD